MEAREIVFLLVVILCLLMSVFSLLYPDWSVAVGRWWARLTGFDYVTPEFFFSRTWVRFGAAWGVLICLIALVAVLLK
jgi:hypothetical protein